MAMDAHTCYWQLRKDRSVVLKGACGSLYTRTFSGASHEAQWICNGKPAVCASA